MQPVTRFQLNASNAISQQRFGASWQGTAAKAGQEFVQQAAKHSDELLKGAQKAAATAQPHADEFLKQVGGHINQFGEQVKFKEFARHPNTKLGMAAIGLALLPAVLAIRPAFLDKFIFRRTPLAKLFQAGAIALTNVVGRSSRAVLKTVEPTTLNEPGQKLYNFLQTNIGAAFSNKSDFKVLVEHLNQFMHHFIQATPLPQEQIHQVSTRLPVNADKLAWLKNFKLFKMGPGLHDNVIQPLHNLRNLANQYMSPEELPEFDKLFRVKLHNRLKLDPEQGPARWLWNHLNPPMDDPNGIEGMIYRKGRRLLGHYNPKAVHKSIFNAAHSDSLFDSYIFWGKVSWNEFARDLKRYSLSNSFETVGSKMLPAPFNIATEFMGRGLGSLIENVLPKGSSEKLRDALFGWIQEFNIKEPDIEGFVQKMATGAVQA